MMGYHCISKRLLAVFTFITVCYVFPQKEIFAQDKVNKSNNKFIVFSTGFGTLTDFSKNKSDFESAEIGYPAFLSDYFALNLQTEFKTDRYEQIYQLNTFYSSAVKYYGGRLEDRNLDENAGSYFHLSFSYNLNRKLYESRRFIFYAGLIGKALIEDRRIIYSSIGKMKTADLYVLTGSALKIEAPVFEKYFLRAGMNNYFALPFLDFTIFKIPAYHKNYRQTLIESDFNISLEYEIAENRFIGLSFTREEYRSLKISEAISVPRKDSNRNTFMFSVKYPIGF
ncbi:hypothetical protein ACFL6G_03585 [candidate division KSB1 bacterium]